MICLHLNDDFEADLRRLSKRMINDHNMTIIHSEKALRKYERDKNNLSEIKIVNTIPGNIVRHFFLSKS